VTSRDVVLHRKRMAGFVFVGGGFAGGCRGDRDPRGKKRRCRASPGTKGGIRPENNPETAHDQCDEVLAATTWRSGAANQGQGGGENPAANFCRRKGKKRGRWLAELHGRRGRRFGQKAILGKIGLSSGMGRGTPAEWGKHSGEERASFRAARRVGPGLMKTGERMVGDGRQRKKGLDPNLQARITPIDGPGSKRGSSFPRPN